VDEMRRFHGVDLHRNAFTVCVLDEDGNEKIENWSIKRLSEYASTLSSADSVAVEATGNTYLFTSALDGTGCRMVVVNPHQFKVISRSVNKTDENDAKTLARFLSKDMLPEDEMNKDISSMVQTRDKLVKLRTALKNKVNNLLAARGIIIKRESLSSEKGLRAVMTLDLPRLPKVELSVLVDQIRSLNQSVKELENAIKEDGKKMDGHRNLTSIKGIGDLGASIIMSVIGDINDFSNEGKLASYFGIVPRVHNSNESVRHGHITKRGSKLGRTTLIQCAMIAKRYNPYLDDYYQRIKSRRGSGKAIVALARKLLSIIYKTLKNNLIFEDFTSFKFVRA
jgi:transposase